METIKTLFLGGHLDGEVYYGPAEERLDKIIPREPDWNGTAEPVIDKVADVYKLRGIKRNHLLDHFEVYFYVENDLTQEEFLEKAVKNIRLGYIPDIKINPIL